MESPESAVQLLVEGTNLVNVFAEFCKSWNLLSIEIRNFGGIQDLRDYLETFVRVSGFSAVTRVGIVRDAEESAGSAFQSIQSSLQNAGLQAPATPRASTSGSPSISVLILPDANSDGNLESLLWRSVAGTSEARCADEFFNCLNLGKIAAARRDKARLQAYLAAKPRPHGSIGVAARRGHWDPEHHAFSELRRFLTDLHGRAGASNTYSVTRNESDVSGERR